MEFKAKYVVILLAFLSIISIVSTATFGYLYFQEKERNDLLASQQDNEDNSKDVEDIPANTDDENAVEPDETEEPKIIAKDIDCSNWAYVDGAEKVPHMFIVYKDSGKVSFENVNDKCMDIVMNYGKAKLYFTYSFGEAYPNLLDKKGTEVVVLKTEQRKSLDGSPYTLTLARQKYTKTEAASGRYPAGYWLNYVMLETKETCESDSDAFGPAVGYPCHSGGNPFVTPAGSFDVYFPKDSTEAQIMEGVEFFDYVAKSSYYKEL